MKTGSMNTSGFFVIALSFFLLCGIIATASAVSVTIGPDQIEEGDTITIDISDLADGRTLTFRMESYIDLQGGSRFSYQTNQVKVPFRLENMEVKMVVLPVTEAGYEVQLGDLIFSERKSPPASSNTVTVRQNIGDRGPGTIDLLKAFGDAVSGSHDVDLLLQLKGTKKGADSGLITFELEGIQNGYVRITIEVDDSVVESKLITIGTPEPIQEPVAAFIADPTEGAVPLTVQFTDESAGDPKAWIWEYSTGNPGWTVFSLEQNPEYEFTQAGTYSIRLTAANIASSDTETKVGYITVFDVPPPVGWTGVFGKGHWFVNDGHQGIADAWHFGDTGDEPFVLADGRTGVFGKGHWFVNDGHQGIADAWHFGDTGDIPFVLPDGRTGVFGKGYWFVNDGEQGIDDAWHFGDTGDIPFVLPDGRTGVFGKGHWFVNDGEQGIDDAWHFGDTGDIPFAVT